MRITAEIARGLALATMTKQAQQMSITIIDDIEKQITLSVNERPEDEKVWYSMPPNFTKNNIAVQCVVDTLKANGFDVTMQPGGDNYDSYLAISWTKST